MLKMLCNKLLIRGRLACGEWMNTETFYLLHKLITAKSKLQFDYHRRSLTSNQEQVAQANTCLLTSYIRI